MSRTRFRVNLQSIVLELLARNMCNIWILSELFWDSIDLAYVSKLGEEGLVYDYLFTSQEETHSVPDMDFFTIPSLNLSHLELSRIELPKLTSSILMGIVTIPAGLVDQFYFNMNQPMKAWLFEKTFELVYPSIFIWFKNHLHPIKAGNTS